MQYGALFLYTVFHFYKNLREERIAPQATQKVGARPLPTYLNLS